MRKGKSPTTLVNMRELLLRIALMVALVGLGGVLMKKGVVAQTTSSIVLTPEEKKVSHWIDKQSNHISDDIKVAKAGWQY